MGVKMQKQAALTYLLTARPVLGILIFPNQTRRNRRHCRAPHGEKYGLFCYRHQCISLGCGYILVEQRPVSVRTGGLPTTGERCSVFFCAQIPKSRCSMFHIITTSRTTRALYRLQSLAERFASVLALAAVFFMAFVGVMA